MMRAMLQGLVPLALAVVAVMGGVAEGGTRSRQKVIYGNDDRTDVCESGSQPLKDLAQQSVVAILDMNVLQAPDGSGSYTTHLHAYRKLGSRRNLCWDQQFRDQPTAAACTGTLIAPDRVLTAGHCISPSSCGRRRFVFDYLLGPDSCEMPTITADDVYRCVRFQRVETDYVDHAVVHLDRPVVGRVPVSVRPLALGALAVGQHLNLIGCGSGLPFKIDTGGNVIDPRSSTLDFFLANTDTFGGNSGSGVFDDDGQLVGILVRGQTDYVTSGGCRKVNVISCQTPTCSRLRDAEELSYPFEAISSTPDCKVDAECTGIRTSKCVRKCAADSTECTGWCV